MDEDQAQTNTNNDRATLDRVRQQAVNSLIPLTDELDTTPEQKFELLMNAVRVTHSATLLEKALAAAQQIQDKPACADALIDVINEANYQASR